MPTVSRGQTISTVTDTTNIRLNISEVIDFLSPTDTPLLTRIGKSSLKFPCDQVKHEWLEDELKPRQTTLAAAYTAGSGTLTVATDAGKYFSTDDLILVDSNVLQILSGPPDSDTFIVVGGMGGSTDANAAVDAIVRRIASALPEASSSRMDATKTHLVRPYNYTQIFKDQVIVSGTMAVIRRYGYVSERAYQEEKVMRQLAIDMEHVMLYGVRSYSAGPPRRSTMGGLFESILLAGVAGSWETVFDADGAQMTETMLNNVLQKVWEKGGSPGLIMVNGFNKRVMNSWASPRVRTEQAESTGGFVMGQYESDYGTLDIAKNRWLRPSDVLILTEEDVGIGPLNGREFSSREVPQLGDYQQTEVLGEYTMEVHRPNMAHGWIYGTAES